MKNDIFYSRYIDQFFAHNFIRSQILSYFIVHIISSKKRLPFFYHQYSETQFPCARSVVGFYKRKQENTLSTNKAIKKKRKKKRSRPGKRSRKNDNGNALWLRTCLNRGPTHLTLGSRQCKILSFLS